MSSEHLILDGLVVMSTFSHQCSITSSVSNVYFSFRLSSSQKQARETRVRFPVGEFFFWALCYCFVSRVLVVKVEDPRA